MKKLINIIYRKLFVRTNEQKRKYLTKRGAKIGNNTIILSGVGAFGSEPYLIEIGDNTLISTDVTLLTHDGGVFVLNNVNFFGGGVR